MPRLFRIEHPAVLIAAELVPPGEYGRGMVSGLFTSEDGDDFIHVLDSLTCYLSAVFRSGYATPPLVDNLLAVVHPDGQATAYCNELRLVLGFRSKRSVSIGAGEHLSRDDIADINEAELRDVKGDAVVVPPNAAVVLILSLGWRKLAYFDFGPVMPVKGNPRKDRFARLLGQFFAPLSFQEMYAISGQQWERLIDWGWFPFMALRHDDRTALLHYAASNRDPSPALEQIGRRYAAGLGRRIELWKGYDYLNHRITFIERAKERLEAGDYVSCIQNLSPQIEGVMRILFSDENPGDQLTQGAMVSNLVGNQHAHSLLLPGRFVEYLKTVYFRAFDTAAGSVPLSRHSIAHGVSKVEDYTFEKAVVCFLVLDQLFYYLSD